MLGVIRLKQRLPRTPDRSYSNPQPLCGLWARKLIFVPFTGIRLKAQLYTAVDNDFRCSSRILSRSWMSMMDI
jgi:hypothetical protein